MSVSITTEIIPWSPQNTYYYSRQSFNTIKSILVLIQSNCFPLPLELAFMIFTEITDGEYVKYSWASWTEWRMCYYLHRLEGPASIVDNGDKWWYIKGVRRRKDGQPPIEHANGTLGY